MLCKELNIFEPTSHSAGYLLWLYNMNPNLKLGLKIPIYGLMFLLLWLYKFLQKGTGGVRQPLPVTHSELKLADSSEKEAEH